MYHKLEVVKPSTRDPDGLRQPSDECFEVIHGMLRAKNSRKKKG
jgi:hypothetical protein